MIVAQTLTDQDADDPSQGAPLLDQNNGPIVRVMADGAYDGDPTSQTIAAHSDDIEVLIPPRSTTVPGSEPGPPTQRDRHLKLITDRRRLAWQANPTAANRAGRNDNGPLQSLIGPRLHARGFAAQQTEAAVGVAVLNRMAAAGHPKSVRCNRVVA